MNRLLLIIAFCLCLVSAVNAQQRFHWMTTGGPGANPPTVLTVNTNGDIIAGSRNILMRSTDDGVNWTRLPIPLYLDYINSAVALPGGNIVALFNNFTIVRMNADGSSLTTLPTTNADWIESDRSGNLFAMQSSTMIARSKDAGDTWDTIIGPSGEKINGFSDDESTYYVATETGIYTSTDQGNSWRRALNGLVTGPYYWILAGHDGYAWANCGNSGFYLSTDYGQEWTRTTLTIDYDYGMVASSNNDVLLMISGPVVATFDGSNAKNSNIGIAPGAFAFDSSGHWLAAANGLPNIYRTSSDTSSVWQSLSVPLSSSSFLYREFSTIVANTLVNVINEPITDRCNFILDTLNDWRLLIRGNSQMPLGMDFFDNSMLGTLSGSDLMRSTDSGKSWSANILASLPAGTVCAAITAPNRIYAATKGVYYTDDVGKDWSETNDNILTGAVTALCSDSSGRLYAACSSSLFTTSDQGNSWQKLPILVPINTVSNMRVNRAGTIAICGSSDIVLRSEDNGANWQINFLPDQSTITDIYISPTSDVFASSNSGVFYWPAGGTNFVNASDGLDSIGVNALAADSAGNIYAATNGMGVWVGVGNPALLGVAEHSSIAGNVTVSPNPASSIVNIALPSSEIWNAVAMDCLGRELPMKYSLTGETLQCDVSNLIPGAYEIIIRSGANQIVSRVQVIR
jgi:photosystem II stability/assembly factor-like uncharacterized protein